MKKHISLVLVLTLFLGLNSLSFGSNSLAKESYKHSVINGENMEFIEILDDGCDTPSLVQKSYGAMDKTVWETFSNRYFYNNMNANQKKFYNDLKSSVDSFFYNELDATGISVNSAKGKETMYVTSKEGVTFEGISSDEAGDIYLVFQNENPQYYFLDNSRIFTPNGNGGKFFPSVYSQFIKASDRSRYNQKYLETVNSYINDVKSYSTEKAERQRRIHSLVAEKLSYASNNELEWPPHQSTATAVLNGVSVCAGYSELYALLCNAVGIPCICVTSTSHEWNMVKYGDYWYNVDITNDDGGKEPRWRYFNVPDSTSFYEGHTPEAIYYSLKLPKAEYNFGDKPLEEVITEGAVFRLYNKNNSEHFFTTSKSERDGLVSKGWQYEGIAFISETNDLSVPVYRVYNKNSGEHYYTTSAGERDSLVRFGWRYENIAFYSNPSQNAMVYVMFNPNSRNAGSHHYTKSYGEATSLQSKGWRYEKIGWYACE